MEQKQYEMSTCNYNKLKSESGTFYIDSKGIAYRFEPAYDNPFRCLTTEKECNYTYRTHKAIRTMIIPQGVKGFVSGFMRGIRVIEHFELPDGLLYIGNNSFDISESQHCVFADCILPSVVIPKSVQTIGNFAFGHSYIDVLQIPSSLHSPYGRQFKDSHIVTLKLSCEWYGLVDLYEHDRLNLNMHTNDYGYLRWHSTTVERLKFY